MSQSLRSPNRQNVLSLDSGLEALQSSPEFRGPVEHLDGHYCNDHFALIYEERAQQLAAVVPFLRQGLERGERCMYVIDETSRAAIVEAMRAGGIDVDAALESGALSFHSVEETYLRNGRFDPEGMIEFYDDAIEEATEEHEALRVAAETAWILDETTDIESFMDYESKVNDLFEGEDCIALCQYDRTLIPPEIIRDIVQTHPHLIYDNAVCHNFYYTPPEEFFGPDQPAGEVDRMLRTLLERTEAKAELAERERYQRELYRVTAGGDRDFEGKLQALFELGCERFGLEMGGMARIDPGTDLFEVEYVSGDHDHLVPGARVALSETYCRLTADGGTADGVGDAVCVSDPVDRGFGDALCYEEFGVRTYLGTKIEVDGGPDRTFFFVSSEPRDREFSEADRSFHRLMGQWVQYELERRHREQYLRESHEITSDPELPFEEKLERLLDLGREWFGLEMAGLSRLQSWDGRFRLETGLGVESDDDPLRTDPGEGCFCRGVIAEDEPVGRADVRGTEWEDDRIHRELGLGSYLGVKVSSGATPYGTLWFASAEPREEPFSDAERTFLELMGQWVSYEIERREHERSQRELYEITADTDLSTDEKIERLLTLGCEYLDLRVGMLNRDRGRAFEVENVVGTHADVEVGTCTPPESEHYCRQAVESGDSVFVADAAAAGWEGDRLHDELGLETYAGIPVTVGGDAYGTICFADGSPRRTAFTDAERAFLELMGQCVGYELEQTHRATRRRALSAVGRELMTAETTAEVAEGVVAAAEGTLETPVAAVALYDEVTGELRPAAHTDAAGELIETASLFGGTDSVAWDAFVADEATRVRDPLADAGDSDADDAGDADDTDGAAEAGDATGTLVSEAVVHPLGTHGVLLVGATAPGGFQRGDAEVVETAASNVRAALDRVDRERQLQKRERTLEEQNGTLERLNRINDIIRNIDQGLVQASTREEIEDVVCEQLAGVGPYELAWIGESAPVSGELTPREWAGAEKGYLDEITVTVDDGPTGRGPAGRAIRTGEPQVVNDVLSEAEFDPWRQAALNRGYHASIALPLAYDDSLYGVLTVYAGQPGVFDELERAVLVELADTIAYAINAVESKKALVSDEVTELEFAVTDDDLGPVTMTDELDCEFSHENVVPRTDAGFRSFFTVHGCSAEEVLAFAPHLPADDVELLSACGEGDEPVCLFEATLNDESLTATVMEHGGRLRGIDAANGTATVTVHLAADANVREFVEMVRRKYPETELVAQRRRERTQQTTMEFSAAVTDELTARQLETLQTAYYSGYFEQPRTRAGSEIAESMDIAQPTFNSHLRTAQRKLYRELFESESLLS